MFVFFGKKASGVGVTNAAELLVHAIQLDVGWHALPLFLQDNSEVLAAQHIRSFFLGRVGAWWRCVLHTRNRHSYLSGIIIIMIIIVIPESYL